MADLFPSNGHQTSPRLVDPPTKADQSHRIVATYDYTDEHGTLLYQAVRYEPKDFRARRPNGTGWIWSTEGVRRVPYRLPEVRDAVRYGRGVIIVEGEKDADRLASLGLTATSNVFGAGKWREEYNPHFSGADVAIIPDNDTAGERHAANVARHVQPVVSSVRIVELPGLPAAGDVSDWLDAGHDRAELKRVISNTPTLESSPEPVEASLRIVTAEQFAYTKEEGADALLGDSDEALIPTNGDIMMYGDGGAGKTTLSVDLALHLAAGDDWLNIAVSRPLAVLIIEDEGPRPRFRVKINRKLTAWTGSPLDGRLRLVEDPWATFSFADPDHRQQLADATRDHELDVVIVGPVSCAGMNDAGTLQETRGFQALLADVRRRAERPVAFLLIHHENKSGKVSGAWEGTGDTLLHVTGQGNGRTRLYIQKARWATSYHAVTLNLRWADGDSFEVERTPELTDEDIADQIIAAIAASAGSGWAKIEKATPGIKAERRRGVRDRLLADGVLVNVVKIDGVEQLLNRCIKGKAARLHLADDPTLTQLRPDRDEVRDEVEIPRPPRGRGHEVQPRPSSPFRGTRLGRSSRPPRGDPAMTTESPTDHTADECDYPWCVAHRPCDCPYASVQPHTRVGCRYRRDDEDQDDEGNGAR